MKTDYVFYCPDRTEFCYPFIFNGAKCGIVANNKYTNTVLFGKNPQRCIVSPVYLITVAAWNRIKKEVKKDLKNLKRRLKYAENKV